MKPYLFQVVYNQTTGAMYYVDLASNDAVTQFVLEEYVPEGLCQTGSRYY